MSLVKSRRTGLYMQHRPQLFVPGLTSLWDSLHFFFFFNLCCRSPTNIWSSDPGQMSAPTWDPGPRWSSYPATDTNTKMCAGGSREEVHLQEERKRPAPGQASGIQSVCYSTCCGSGSGLDLVWVTGSVCMDPAERWSLMFWNSFCCCWNIFFIIFLSIRGRVSAVPGWGWGRGWGRGWGWWGRSPDSSPVRHIDTTTIHTHHSHLWCG